MALETEPQFVILITLQTYVPKVRAQGLTVRVIKDTQQTETWKYVNNYLFYRILDRKVYYENIFAWKLVKDTCFSLRFNSHFIQ